MFVKQMEVGQFSIFAYLLGSEATGEALVVDPAAEGEMILKEAEKKGLRIKYIVNTHSHIDHVMGNKKMKGSRAPRSSFMKPTLPISSINRPTS